MADTPPQRELFSERVVTPLQQEQNALAGCRSPMIGGAKQPAVFYSLSLFCVRECDVTHIFRKKRWMKMDYKTLLAQMPPEVLKAYEVYAKTHSISETAKIVGKHRNTIYKWRKKYKWDEIEKAQIQALVEGTQEYIEQLKEEQRKILDETIKHVVAQIKEGKLKARSLSDLVALLKYRLELEGEFKEETNVSVNVNLSIASLHEELMKRRKQALEGSGDEAN